MLQPALDDRQSEVLKSVIQAHVATGEPVGSETLARMLNRTLSPATLRNIMADLERLGLLDHPHTSAGRVPTDEGYRRYVDGLMSRELLSPRELAAIRSGLRSHEASAQDVMEGASHLLSRLARSVAFVIAPDLAKASFRHVDFVRLPPPRILVVMLSQAGIITNKVIELPEELAQEELAACANYLNAHFAGMHLAEIRSRLLGLMKQEKALYDSLLQRVIALGEQAFEGMEEDPDVYLDGRSNILAQPEFEDVAKMRALFLAFEEKGRLVKILNACLAGDGVRIVIGHENPDPDLRETSLVAARYPFAGEGGFGVGVLGSTRMEYARVIALVDHVAREVARALAELRA